MNLPPTGESDLEINQSLNAHLSTNSDWPEYALKFLIGRIALAIGSAFGTHLPTNANFCIFIIEYELVWQ